MVYGVDDWGFKGVVQRDLIVEMIFMCKKDTKYIDKYSDLLGT